MHWGKTRVGRQQRRIVVRMVYIALPIKALDGPSWARQSSELTQNSLSCCVLSWCVPGLNPHFFTGHLIKVLTIALMVRFTLAGCKMPLRVLKIVDNSF